MARAVREFTALPFHNRLHMNKPTPRRPATGFTLIELMVAVVVVGILLAVALPSFMDSIRKGRRSEAFAALAALQQAQERYRGNNATYASTLTSLNITTPTGPSGYYALSIAAPTATGYDLSAEAVSGKSQVNDGNCGKLSVQVLGGSIKYASCSSSGSCTYTYNASDVCWSR